MNLSVNCFDKCPIWQPAGARESCPDVRNAAEGFDSAIPASVRHASESSGGRNHRFFARTSSSMYVESAVLSMFISSDKPANQSSTAARKSSGTRVS